MTTFKVPILKSEPTKKNEIKEGSQVLKVFSDRKSCLRYCYNNKVLFYYKDNKKVYLASNIYYIIYEYNKESNDLTYKFEFETLKGVSLYYNISINNLSKSIIDDIEQLQKLYINNQITLIKNQFVIYKDVANQEEE